MPIKYMKPVVICFTALVVLIAGVARASAQDPVVVNGKTIHVKKENARVRVLEAELPPRLVGLDSAAQRG